MRTENHFDHNDGLNEQDNGDDDGRNDDDTTSTAGDDLGGWIREKGTSWDGDGWSFLSRMRMMSTASMMARWGGLQQR